MREDIWIYDEVNTEKHGQCRVYRIPAKHYGKLKKILEYGFDYNTIQVDRKANRDDVKDLGYALTKILNYFGEIIVPKIKDELIHTIDESPKHLHPYDIYRQYPTYLRAMVDEAFTQLKNEKMYYVDHGWIKLKC